MLAQPQAKNGAQYSQCARSSWYSKREAMGTCCFVVMCPMNWFGSSSRINTREPMEPIPAKVYMLAQLLPKNGRTVFAVSQNFMARQTGN